MENSKFTCCVVGKGRLFYGTGTSVFRVFKTFFFCLFSIWGFIFLLGFFLRAYLSGSTAIVQRWALAITKVAALPLPLQA